MTPVSDSGFTFQIASLATLRTVLTDDVLSESLRPQILSLNEAMVRPNWSAGGSTVFWTTPTPKMFADIVAASPPAQSSQVDPVTIRAVLALALVGGGMAATAATDTAERLHRGQNGRHMDFLAATIVQAVVAAGV